MGFFGVACGFAVVLFLLYRYLTSTFNFWKKRNIPGPDPIPIFGTMKDIFLRKEYCGLQWKRIYDTYKDEPFVGLFSMREPTLLIRDTKYIKDVLIKDASLFSTRGMPFYVSAEPLRQFIFFAEGRVAHPLKSRVSSAFTPSKLREVFNLMQESVARLENYMDALIAKDSSVNCTDLSFRLSGDMIGSAFMGIDIKSLILDTSEQNVFVDGMKMAHHSSMVTRIYKILTEMFPDLYNCIGYHLFNNDKLTTICLNVVNGLVSYRKKHNIVKSDLLGLLTEIMDNPNELANVYDITNSFIVAQVFGFFHAGLESSASILTNTLYELALNQNIQDRLREEMRNFSIKRGELTYNNIHSLSYLNAVFKETMRKYPAADSLQRRTTSSYTFSDTNITVPKGQAIVIPVYALHHNPTIYPKPEVYDPERFTEEAFRSRDPMYFLPFGYGGRGCIGERLGGYQTKLAIAAFLQIYRVDICEKTIPVFRHDIFPMISTSADPIYLKVTKVDS